MDEADRQSHPWDGERVTMPRDLARAYGKFRIRTKTRIVKYPSMFGPIHNGRPGLACKRQRHGVNAGSNRGGSTQEITPDHWGMLHVKTRTASPTESAAPAARSLPLQIPARQTLIQAG